MKRGEMMALSNRGGTRTAVERASAWLLSHLEAGSCLDAASWVSARDIEVARSKTGVSRAALNRARRWLQQTGHIEKCRRGYQGPWMYRRGGLEVQALSVVRCGQRCAGDGRAGADIRADPACGGDPLPWSAVLVHRWIVWDRPHMARPR